MPLIDRTAVRKLLDAQQQNAALVLLQGECVVMEEAQADEQGGLVIARRREVRPVADDHELDLLVARLDTMARELGA
jgi:redox-sensitive bicupin YhaK (pirin superfamily)